VCASTRAGSLNRHGFTLLEVMFVITISVIMMAAVINSFSSYTRERSAQQAAYLLSRDLRLARATAIGSRQPVSLVVSPTTRSYVIRDTRGTIVARRTFAAGSEMTIETLTLGLPGDSVTFSAQGVATLTGVTSGVAEAVIGSPRRQYVVRFNATGSSRIIER
jgi:prepilin-type N-terminal cleavage/methylation domain-containing protein